MTEDEKLEFGDMVRRAKGSQSLSEFSKKTGISKYQLSRIMNGKLKELPRKATLAAIMENCEAVDVKMELALSLSSYVQKEEAEKKNKPNSPHDFLLSFLNLEIREKRRERIRLQMGRILAELAETSHTWVRKRVEDRLQVAFADWYLYIEFLDDTKMKKWHIYFIPKSQKVEEFFYTFLGRLSCCQIGSDEKFILVPATESMYEQLLNKKTDCNVNLSVIYFDNEECTESMEEYLRCADNITKEDIKNSAFLESTTAHLGKKEVYIFKDSAENMEEGQFI